MNHRKSRIGVIFRKEFREIFRDRRTVFTVVISPLLITPALFAILGTVIRGTVEKRRTETVKVGVAGGAHAPDILRQLRRQPNLQVVEIPASEADARVKSRELRAAAILTEESAKQLKAGRPAPLTIVLDPGSDTSSAGAGRLKAAFEQIGRKIVEDRLRARGLPPDAATAFKPVEKPIAQGGSAGTLMLSMFLPYILALSSFAGGLYAANDQVAGEKERGTLETLLASPASRGEIVAGKFLAIAAVCLVSSLLAVAGLILPFISGLKAFEWLARDGLRIDAAAVLTIILVQIPLAITFAGILLAVSTFARNQKEAQTYQGPLLMAVLLPAMMSMLIGTDTTPAMALIPVLNATMVLRQAISSTLDPAFVSLAVLSAIVYAGISVLFSTRLFQRESVLLKG